MNRCAARTSLSLFAVFALAGCSRDVEWSGSLDDFLESRPERFGAAVADPEKHRVQVIYTQIDRDVNNVPAFRTYTYRVDEGEYFYPASTVKLPTALLALEKINELAIAGLTRDTTMLTGANRDSQTAVISDPTSPTGLPSVAHYIRKILLVSDNDAFNRLYEFLGQQPLNEAMHAKGYGTTRIMHRLEVALGIEENRHTNPMVFVGEDRMRHEQPAGMSDIDYTAGEPILLGRAEIVDGVRLERPKDFAEKNAYPLMAQHDVIRALMFPESVPADRRFGLTEEDYRFVHRYMSMSPSESGIQAYDDPDSYPGGYVRFLLSGGEGELPNNVRVFNKVGDAYGFLTDAAFIVDFEHGVEFILAATVYTNENGTFNDDEYEYDDVGFPFLRELGLAIYELELARPRAHKPNLDRFRGSEKGTDRKQETESGERDADDRADDAQ